ncbi:MAG TPA: hypothetical protein VHL98_02435 [Microvirga sp.]|jgi:hypothetical protein|nr:hypothetical protein [Microvirga sp.]
MTRCVGITVLPEYFQNEGVDAVLDNIVRRAGATAVATSPYVMAPAAEGQGSREPPIDAGAGQVRLLDRPLWGRRELWVRTAPSFAPDRSLYAGLRYAPASPDALSEAEGGIVAAAVAAAKARGLEVHLQVQAAIPPGYRVQFGGPEAEDRPLLPDGSAPALRVDNNGSLASPHILAYTQALIRDLVRAYPGIDVIRLDWPEYPPYSLDALFFDFSPHAVAAMAGLGLDPERMRRDVDALRRAVLSGQVRFDGYDAVRFLQRHPGVLDWVRAKGAIVTRFIGACADTLREASSGRIALMPQSFPPPWTLASGFDTRAVSGLGVGGIGVKLYTMHWPMILRAYADPILANGGTGEADRLAGALSALLDDGSRPLAYGDVRYPEPEEPHPAGREAQARKIRQAQREAGTTPVHAFAHGYGPVDDVRARVAVAFEAAERRLWVNRYGYLSDAKLDAIGAVTGAPGRSP